MATLTIILAKEPLPGQVKTRLSPPFSPEMACRLYHCFLEDIIEAMVRLRGMEVAIAFTPAGGRGFFQNLAPPKVRLVAQEGRDLGERQAGAFAWGFDAGYDVVLLRGSDTPDLPGDIMLEAVEKLGTGSAQVVLGPSRDGGYYLIGLKGLQPRLFEGLSWSTDSVLADTLSRARELDLEVHLLPYWRDIDNYADLLDFLKRSSPSLRAGRRSVRAAREMMAAAAPVD